MEEVRKARNKIQKKSNLLFPIPLEALGTDDDPCFGKLYDPRTPECKRCGDSEICALKMSQNTEIKRLKIENEQPIRDLVENDLNEPNKKEIKILAKKRIREVIKLSNQPITREYIIGDVHALFFDRGFTKKRIGKLLDIISGRNKSILIKNNLYSWKASLTK